MAWLSFHHQQAIGQKRHAAGRAYTTGRQFLLVEAAPALVDWRRLRGADESGVHPWWWFSALDWSAHQSIKRCHVRCTSGGYPLPDGLPGSCHRHPYHGRDAQSSQEQQAGRGAVAVPLDVHYWLAGDAALNSRSSEGATWRTWPSGGAGKPTGAINGLLARAPSSRRRFLALLLQ